MDVVPRIVRELKRIRTKSVLGLARFVDGDYVKLPVSVPRQCNICGFEGKFHPFGFYFIHPDAKCGNCGSLERHRLLHLFLQQFDGWPENARVLHFAPEGSVKKFIKPIAAEYVTADLFRKNVKHNWNLESIDCEDDRFDVIVVSHVLEHVNSDRALSEIKRVLSPGGVALLMIPICEGLDQTYENTAAAKGSDVDRWVHFQQYDHIRIYGRDFRDRVRAAGLALDEFVAQGPDVAKYGLLMGERVFVATHA